MKSPLTTPTERDRFIEAAVTVLGWAPEYAGEVFDVSQDMTADPERMFRALEDLSRQLLARGADSPRE